MATGKHKDIWYETGIPRQEAELHECLEAGFPYQVYNKLADISGLSKKEVAEAAAIAPGNACPAAPRQRGSTGTRATVFTGLRGLWMRRQVSLEETGKPQWTG